MSTTTIAGYDDRLRRLGVTVHPSHLSGEEGVARHVLDIDQSADPTSALSDDATGRRRR